MKQNEKEKQRDNERESKKRGRKTRKRNEIASLQSPLSFLCPYEKKREKIDRQTARTKKIVTKERDDCHIVMRYKANKNGKRGKQRRSERKRGLQKNI
jgi:hypothetical protein